jgi:hypothetical protein
MEEMGDSEREKRDREDGDTEKRKKIEEESRGRR